MTQRADGIQFEALSTSETIVSSRGTSASYEQHTGLSSFGGAAAVRAGPVVMRRDESLVAATTARGMPGKA